MKTLLILVSVLIVGCGGGPGSTSGGGQLGGGGAGGVVGGMGGAGGAGGSAVNPCMAYDELTCGGYTYAELSTRCEVSFGPWFTKPVVCKIGSDEPDYHCQSLTVFSVGTSADCGGGPLDIWCCDSTP